MEIFVCMVLAIVLIYVLLHPPVIRNEQALEAQPDIQIGCKWFAEGNDND